MRLHHRIGHPLRHVSTNRRDRSGRKISCAGRNRTSCHSDRFADINPIMDFSAHSIIWVLVIGLIVGAIAKLLMPGKDPGGCIITMLLGIAGAFVGLARTPLWRRGYWRLDHVGRRRDGALAALPVAFPQEINATVHAVASTGIASLRRSGGEWKNVSRRPRDSARRSDRHVLRLIAGLSKARGQGLPEEFQGADRTFRILCFLLQVPGRDHGRQRRKLASSYHAKRSLRLVARISEQRSRSPQRLFDEMGIHRNGWKFLCDGYFDVLA